jgi:hypothetical protein
MVLSRKLRANRANARHSTGPKSRAGKARSARNSRRHGLSVPVWSDPKLAANAETLARAIAGDGASVQIMAIARNIGEAQIDLIRIQQVRHDLLATSQLSTDGPDSMKATNPDLGSAIAAIDRYERRTLSRRKTAIRTFDAAQIAGA